MSVTRQSSGPKAAPDSVMAAIGMMGAKPPMRSMRPANSALAAIGMKPGACGKSRATTSKPMRNATSSRSVQRIDGLWSDFGVLASIEMIPYRGSRSAGFYHTRGAAFHPFGDDCGKRIEAVGQRGRTRLQNQRRFYLAQKTSGDRGNSVKSGAGSDFCRHKFLAAPGADDDVGARGDDFVNGHDAVFGVLARGELREHLDAARRLHKFRHPAEPGNHWLVPFLEIDARMPWQAQGMLMHGIDARRELRRQRPGFVGGADQRAQRADHVEDAGDV